MARSRLHIDRDIRRSSVHRLDGFDAVCIFTVAGANAYTIFAQEEVRGLFSNVSQRSRSILICLPELVQKMRALAVRGKRHLRPVH